MIMDIALNHTTGANPLAALYWNSSTNQPAANNPWLNVSATHPYNVFNDFNHESLATRYFTSRVVEEAGGVDARIEVITTASMIPYEVGENYLDAFGKIGCTNIGLLHIRTRQDAMNNEFIDRIRNCDAVMFSGGNQLRLSATDGGTEFLSILKKRYKEENFVIAGTSAGAMAMSNTMIYEGNAARAQPGVQFCSSIGQPRVKSSSRARISWRPKAKICARCGAACR